MNTENATEPKYETCASLVYSKEVCKAFLSASRIALRFRRTTPWGEGVVQIECFKKEQRIPGQESHCDFSIGFFECRAFIGTGRYDKLRQIPGWTEYSREDDNSYRPERGFWGLSYVNQQGHKRSIFQVLPLGSELTFHVRLDYGTSPNMALSGLHGDILELAARKGKKSLSFELDRVTTKNNSARFGYHA